jgi:hypothetical protein
MWTDP